jgi:hypothetical protein
MERVNYLTTEGTTAINYPINCLPAPISVTCGWKITIMKNNKLCFLLVFIAFGFLINAQTNFIAQHWYEAPESSKGDTIHFKTIPRVLGANDDPAYHWSDFTVNTNNTFDIAYWRWCPAGNYSYNGTWNNLTEGKIIFDFGEGKCKCEMQIISITATELKAIIKETN